MIYQYDDKVLCEEKKDIIYKFLLIKLDLLKAVYCGEEDVTWH